MRPITLPSGRPPRVRPLRTPPLSARKLERTFGQRWAAFKLLLDLIRRGRNGSGFAWRAKAVRRAHNKHRLKVPVDSSLPEAPNYVSALAFSYETQVIRETHTSTFVHRI